MQILTCPVCSEPYPLYLFEFGIPFSCRCGTIMGPPAPLSVDPTKDESIHGEPSPEVEPDRWPRGRIRLYSADDRRGPEPSHPPEIELSATEWEDLRAELEAREGRVAPEFDWPYRYHRAPALGDDARRARELQRRADRICYLISATSYSRDEIDREQRLLREKCRLYFPEIVGAYEKVYARRFARLWKQFRDDA